MQVLYSEDGFMATTVWQLPVPATDVEEEWVELLDHGDCELSFEYEGDEAIIHTKIVFLRVESFKYSSLYAISAEMIDIAYAKIAELGESEWLTEIRQRMIDHNASMRPVPPNTHADLPYFDVDNLKHLAIHFDGAGLYEFICRGFEVKTQQKTQLP